MLRSSVKISAMAIGCILVGACSGGGSGGGSGGAAARTGGSGSGGVSGGTGGAPSGTGGTPAGTGGTPAGTGGTPAGTGGAPAGTGGTPAGTGGTPAGTGGATGGGGGTTAGTGGATGGRGGTMGGTGGATGGRGGTPGGTGGRGGTMGGTGGAGGAASADMTFFVTSRGMGNGGNLNGLDGADAFCKSLAMAVSPALGAKTWRAYLSTSTVDARDRIGAGPWRNARGTIVGNTVAQIHDQATGGMADSTWPTNNATIALDETGAMVPTSGMNANVHDILTGSNADGTVGPAHCNNWTSSATTDTAWNGHSNRSGGGTRPSSWNSAHTVGCGQPGAGMNFQSGTVSSGGGRGSFYCFALP